MPCVEILAVEVLNNPAKFTDQLGFKITFKCISKTQEDIDWRVTWVGSAKSEQHDQVLDEVAVPPEPGVCSFDLIVDAPDPSKIPGGEFLGVTVVMVQALYKGKEFVRVGYYVKVEYADEKLREEPPDVEVPDVSLLDRNILHTEPRVTRYLIDWDEPLIQPDAGMAVSSPSIDEQAGMQTADMPGMAQPQIQPAAVAASGN